MEQWGELSQSDADREFMEAMVNGLFGSEDSDAETHEFMEALREMDRLP